ncbi:DUF4381 domain-containing protein [Zestomonas carbonaria]|uniref:DUF4381 domain-containing protein n=1 Tax=Zestomonas carbonaria TaxID=2762745 RepID=A0A7U7ERG9_9GAMM|nr:DUF4381 domain-containing protein [Pseudomonas carbonaria]CAD5109387.1 hypothetical protein PSEWESI4_03684 [Pseudomonas carbonaria]
MNGHEAPRLDQLRELPPVDPLVSYWPQTWGWLLVLLVLLAGLAFWAGRRWRRWRRDRYRREALLRLAELERALGDEHGGLAALREIPELLKRVALSMPGSPPVAALGGADWQGFLERTSPRPLPARLGEQLATLAYAPAPTVQALADDLPALLGACRDWIENHHVAD